MNGHWYLTAHAHLTPHTGCLNKRQRREIEVTQDINDAQNVRVIWQYTDGRRATNIHTLFYLFYIISLNLIACVFLLATLFFVLYFNSTKTTTTATAVRERFNGHYKFPERSIDSKYECHCHVSTQIPIIIHLRNGWNWRSYWVDTRNSSVAKELFVN